MIGNWQKMDDPYRRADRRTDKQDPLTELLAEVACPEPCEGRHGIDNGWHDSACIPMAQGFTVAVRATVLRQVADDLEARHCSFAGLTYLRELADEATP